MKLMLSFEAQDFRARNQNVERANFYTIGGFSDPLPFRLALSADAPDRDALQARSIRPEERYDIGTRDFHNIGEHSRGSRPYRW
jgi:hypothetical protein